MACGRACPLDKHCAMMRLLVFKFNDCKGCKSISHVGTSYIAYPSCPFHCRHVGNYIAQVVALQGDVGREQDLIVRGIPSCKVFHV